MPLPLAGIVIGTAGRAVAARVGAALLTRAPKLTAAGYSATTVGAGRPPTGQVVKKTYNAFRDSFEPARRTGLPRFNPFSFGGNLVR
jgi:hypothetical protein